MPASRSNPGSNDDTDFVPTTGLHKTAIIRKKPRDFANPAILSDEDCPAVVMALVKPGPLDYVTRLEVWRALDTRKLNGAHRHATCMSLSMRSRTAQRIFCVDSTWGSG